MRNKFFIVCVFLGSVFYLFSIFYIPQFIADDYPIFTYVSQHPEVPITADPGVKFFLFTRPLSYFYFWFDYHLFYTNSVLMKLESLTLFILSMILVFLTLKKIIRILKIDIPESIVILGVLIYLFHPDSLFMNIWIANRTELLSILFYSSSVFFFLKYFDNNNLKFLIFSCSCYLFGILSKQSGLHLPFVFFLFYLVLLKNNIHFNRKVTNIFFIVLIIVFIAITYFNIEMGKNNLNIVLESYWKKPFSIVGISLLIIQPVIGELVYNYFLLNKVLALVLLLFLILSGIILMKKSKFWRNRNNKNLLFFILIYIISFYPRLSGWGENRSNTIQLFWLILILITITSSLIKNTRYRVMILGAIIFINFWNLLFNLENQKNIISINEKKFLVYNNSYKDGDVYLVADPDIFVFPYQLHFLRTNNFGIDEIINSSIYFRTIILNSGIIKSRTIKCEQDNNVIKVETQNEDLFLLYDKEKLESVLTLTNSQTGRGYSSIVFAIPLSDSKKIFIYFDGEKWRKI